MDKGLITQTVFSWLPIANRHLRSSWSVSNRSLQLLSHHRSLILTLYIFFPYTPTHNLYLHDFVHAIPTLWKFPFSRWQTQSLTKNVSSPLTLPANQSLPAKCSYSTYLFIINLYISFPLICELQKRKDHISHSLPLHVLHIPGTQTFSKQITPMLWDWRISRSQPPTRAANFSSGVSQLRTHNYFLSWIQHHFVAHLSISS